MSDDQAFYRGARGDAMIDDDLLFEYRGKQVEVYPREGWDRELGLLLRASAVGVKVTRLSDGKVAVYPWSAIARVVAS